MQSPIFLPKLKRTIIMKKMSFFLSFFFFVAFAFLSLATTSATASFVTGRAGDYSAYSYTVDSLPNVFPENRAWLIDTALRQEAAIKSISHRLPVSEKEWEADRATLRNRILEKTGAVVNQKLPLDIKETGEEKMNGYRIKNIAFQTQPGIYATANLYVPDGSGKFPGVIVMMGHSSNGRFYDKYQSIGITLALHGYVALCIDPWGSGERTTADGVFEDHGDENNLGIALMDVGKTLMGMQITDNIRGVDVLCALPYVDANRLGATGSSGGGNQTIWLAALDNRIKAAVPVVSAGTYESFIMGSPCICEILPDGLTFTEEAGVLALIAPRSLEMCNHSRDANAAFNPREMLKSYVHAKPVFNMLDAGNDISYKLFDLAHGYYPEDRLAMLNWFNIHLKRAAVNKADVPGTGASGTGVDARDIDTIMAEMPFYTLPVDSLRVYPVSRRDPAVASTAQYCKKRGSELRSAFLKNQSIDPQAKRMALKNILRIRDEPVLKETKGYPEAEGWVRFALETSDNKSIPLLVRIPLKTLGPFVIISDPSGKRHISADLIDSLLQTGVGIGIVDLSGTGETAGPSLHSNDSTGRLRTYSKSCLLLGKTVMGEWVKELQIVCQFIHSTYNPSKISFIGSKEAGLAGMFLTATGTFIDEVTLINAPLSYLFDNRDSIEYFSTGIHIPGFLNWGDVSLAAALTGKKLVFQNGVSMSGRKIEGGELKKMKEEFDAVRKNCKGSGTAVFD
jgi:hypothetical protein